MRYELDLDERQYAMLCGDAILLSASGRCDVWSARSVSGRWRLGAGERQATEMREIFRIRGMTDAVAKIDTALALPRERGTRGRRAT